MIQNYNYQYILEPFLVYHLDVPVNLIHYEMNYDGYQEHLNLNLNYYYLKLLYIYILFL